MSKNPLATPVLVIGLASLAVFPVGSTLLSFLTGGFAAVAGSIAMRGDGKQGRAAIGMVLGLVAFLTSGMVGRP